MTGSRSYGDPMSISEHPQPTIDTNDSTDPRELFARGVAVATATIAAVAPQQLTAPTPCPDLDVRSLLAHLVGVANRVAAIGRGEDGMSVSGTSAAENDDWASAWAKAAARAQDDWRRDGALEQTVVLPWATASGGETLLSYLEEIVVHTWDLGQATGQQPTWDDDVIAASYRAISSSLPPEGRTAMFERLVAELAASGAPSGFGGAPFAEAVPVRPDARPSIYRMNLAFHLPDSALLKPSVRPFSRR